MVGEAVEMDQGIIWRLTMTQGERITLLEKVVSGNGNIGLVQKVDEHDKYISEQKGAFHAIKWIGGLLGLLLVVLQIVDIISK